jgi:hypothetical protein
VTESAFSASEDPYLYPESGVLINRFGIQDAELLTQVEGAGSPCCGTSMRRSSKLLRVLPRLA